ncbi:hypothetical protein LCGC14_2291080, partial [marine sediment metagenome]
YNYDKQQIKRARSLFDDFRAHPFWRLKFWYQALDGNTAEGQPHVGFGLWRAWVIQAGTDELMDVSKEEMMFYEMQPGDRQVWLPKPVLTAMRVEMGR